jgi:3-dehydroquinate synthase
LDISDFKDEDIFDLLLNDKKNVDSNINFSLLSGIGSCAFDHKCSKKNITASLKFYRELNDV